MRGLRTRAVYPFTLAQQLRDCDRLITQEDLRRDLVVCDQSWQSIAEGLVSAPSTVWSTRRVLVSF